MDGKLPQMIVTGASGFVGRRLLDDLKHDYRIFGLDRRTSAESGAPVHPNILWFQVDLADREQIEQAFAQIRREGGAEIVIHLAAYYDFTGEEHPEYQRTNVDALRNVLEQCTTIRPRRFVFASSLAVSDLPPTGSVLNEWSPTDGKHLYARTKAIGEAMVREYEERFPSCIIRFAAMFSDWCEYPPLYFFLLTWFSGRWNRRVLGGRGRSAVPYLHVRDAVVFFRHVLDRADELAPGEILIASNDGCTSHQELFDRSTREYFGSRIRSWHVPRLLCRPGMWALDVVGRLLGSRPFERPWMADYIDRQMAVDGSHTRSRLEWEPRPRLHILRRMPFLVENFKIDPLTWHHRNQTLIEKIEPRVNLRVHWLLLRHQEQISDLFTRRLLGTENRALLPSYQRVPAEAHQWRHRQLLRHLMITVRTREKGLLLGYCSDLAMQRQREGFQPHEVTRALEILGEVCLDVLRHDPEAEALEPDLHEHILFPLRVGIDQVEETFEAIEGQRRRARHQRQQRLQ